MKGLWRKLRAREGPPRAPPEPVARTAAPEPDPWRAAWRDGAAAARRRSAELRMDLSYGASGSERLDLYLPVHRPRNLPFVAYVAGVGWRAFDKSDSGFPARAVHRRGAAFVAIGFDGAPEADVETQAEQVRRAWLFLLDNAAHLGLDAGRGHLVGHSSGAHLAALTAFDPDVPPPVSAVLVSGIYDLEPVSRRSPGHVPGLREDNAARLSPLRGVRRIDSELVVAWGERDDAEVRRQSREFAHVCRSKLAAVTHGELAGRMHLDTSFELADPHSRVLQTIRTGNA